MFYFTQSLVQDTDEETIGTLENAVEYLLAPSVQSSFAEENAPSSTGSENKSNGNIQEVWDHILML